MTWVFHRGDTIRIDLDGNVGRYRITDVQSTDGGHQLGVEPIPSPPMCPDHWIPGAGDERIATVEFGCATCQGYVEGTSRDG